MIPLPRALVAIALSAFIPSCVPGQPAHKTQNIIFVMTDGLRWQEAFRGADAALMNQASGVSEVAGLKRLYWRGTAQARREALMPFLWRTIAGEGQIFGNRDLGSDAFVTNGLNFSYPGYNETLCGFPDPRIRSNDNIPNPNVTVLEWLNRKPAYHGKVAAFGAWEVIASIVNGERGGFVTNAGYAPFTAAPITPAIEQLNRLKADTRIWEDEPLDAFAFHTAMEYVKLHKPRVLYLSLGETDDWAHEGKYDLYLQAAHRVDEYVKELWETVQSMEEYRGKTTLVLSIDHGRGLAPVAWKSHGEKIPDSKYIWMAFLGPDTRPLGERANLPPVTQNRIAATLAGFLGEDYRADVPNAGKAIEGVLPQ
jgi:hypothetical protein